MFMATEPTAVNGASHISGRGLRRRKLSRSQRVRLAAALVAREAQLDPSIGQACALLNVPAAEVREELKARVAQGKVSTLVAAWAAATESERAPAVQTIGVANVWDVLSRIVE
jgi:hypothetical protein